MSARYKTTTLADGTVRQRAEVYTRVMGYHRPVSAFNAGKQAEHRERTYFRDRQPTEEPRS